MTKTVVNKYRCLVGFVILSSSISVVGGAECKCPQITPRRGVEITCKNSQGKTIDCSSPALPLSTINYKCSPFYRPALRGSIVRRQLQCSQDCSWQNMRRLEEFICEIDCGKPSQPHVPFIAKGEKTLRYSWPWHATIFVKDEKSMQNHYKCGGTLISEHVILTAAHCLITRRQYPKESYHIVLGAISSNWTENMDDPNAQFFRIKENYVADEYDRVEHSSDIGLVELDKSILLSETVSPACFPYDSDSGRPQDPIEIGEGEVVGYGQNEYGEYERYLKYARLPVVGAAKCYEILDKRQGREQFCAGVENGSVVCNGDSGGGMVFKGQGMSRYYVQGIVSHGVVNRNKPICDGVSYFTNVLHFIKWVAEIVDRIGEMNEWLPEETTSSTQNTVVHVSGSSTTPAVPDNEFVGKDGQCTEVLIIEEGVDITCENRYDGKPISCFNAPNNTLATYACKYRYHSTLFSTTRLCINGIWTKRSSTWWCSLECGLGANRNIYAKPSKITNLPWNVALYQKSPMSGDYEYFCGGTLISQSVVITTAVCVTWYNSTIPRVTDKIILYFGKVNKNMDIIDGEFVQMLGVRFIHVHEKYKPGFHEFDIAVIITDKIVTITESVGPVCLPTQCDIQAGDLGTLTRFEMGTNDLLKETTIQVLDPPLNRNLIRAGYENGTLGCGYDGAGLYFEGRSKKWELHGLTIGCNIERVGIDDPMYYPVFVQVVEFMDWINKILNIYNRNI